MKKQPGDGTRRKPLQLPCREVCIRPLLKPDSRLSHTLDAEASFRSTANGTLQQLDECCCSRQFPFEALTPEARKPCKDQAELKLQEGLAAPRMLLQHASVLSADQIFRRIRLHGKVQISFRLTAWALSAAIFRSSL